MSGRLRICATDSFYALVFEYLSTLRAPISRSVGVSLDGELQCESTFELDVIGRDLKSVREVVFARFDAPGVSVYEDSVRVRERFPLVERDLLGVVRG